MRRAFFGLTMMLAACSGGEQTATVKADPAPPDTLTKLRNELTAAVIAAEASCSAAWLERSVEPPCARFPRRALLDSAQAWMMTDATLASVAAAAIREPNGDLRALHGRLLLERVLRDAADSAGVVTLAKALKYPDTPAMLSDLHGFDIRATASAAARALSASEGLYLVARTDVAVAAADVDALTATSFTAAGNSDLARSLVNMLRPGREAPTTSLIKNATESAAEPFFITPSSQRVIAADVAGAEDLANVSRAFARASHRTVVGSADAAMELMGGYIAGSVLGTPDWLTQASQIPEPALTRVIRAQAYRAIENARADAARVVDMLAQYDGAPTISDASDPYMFSAVRFRGRLLAAEVTAQLVNSYGASWWQWPESAAVLTKILDAPTSDALLASLGHELTSDAFLVVCARALARGEPIVTLQ
ncbi:MAG: hypothetical protein H7Z43_06890 [Clostridia bacterium]|nr:hypothetical protein [Deltaproteobacteria bacterium]